jgi:hypothetical protein
MVVGIVGLGGTINVAIEAGCPGGWGVFRVGSDGGKDWNLRLFDKLMKLDESCPKTTVWYSHFLSLR